MIAEKMADLHQLNIPINKDSTWLWDTMDRWLQQPIKDVNWSRDNLELDQILSTNLCEEARWLKYVYILCCNSSVVLGQNYKIIFYVFLENI